MDKYSELLNLSQNNREEYENLKKKELDLKNIEISSQNKLNYALNNYENVTPYYEKYKTLEKIGNFEIIDELKYDAISIIIKLVNFEGRKFSFYIFNDSKKYEIKSDNFTNQFIDKFPNYNISNLVRDDSLTHLIQKLNNEKHDINPTLYSVYKINNDYFCFDLNLSCWYIPHILPQTLININWIKPRYN